jgi:peptidoglycan/xylan/chitin deacetylase (PgdA/CDA1 family)
MIVRRKRRQRVRTAGWLATVAGAGILGWLMVDSAGLPIWTAALSVVAALVLGDRFMRVPGGVPVIVYHSVSRDQDWLPWSDQIAVTPEGFERQLALLRRHGFTVLSNDDFLHRRRNRLAMPQRPVVIHLDDGYLDNWVAAVPILRRHAIPATIMVSLDFIEPGDELRATIDDAQDRPLSWKGYMNWAEIRRIEQSGLVSIEAHGTDHGRVETGPRVVDELRADNWRRLAWVQWRATAASKDGWFRHKTPPAVPFGTPVRQNAPALAARAWTEDGCESEADYAARVRTVLERSRDTLRAQLGRVPTLFCWPENATTEVARDIARDAGYLATTGGTGENRQNESPDVVSRVHAGDRVLGWQWPLIDDLHLLANCRAFHGNYYWCLPMFAINGLSRLTRLGRMTKRRQSARRLMPDVMA